MLLKKTNYFLFDKKSKSLIINSGENIYSIQDNIDFYLALLSFLRYPQTFEDILEEINKKGFNLDSDNLKEIINEFFKKGILEEYTEYEKDILSKKEIEKFDRQIIALTNFKNINTEKAYKAQEKLKKSHVMIIGVGGVGGHLAYSLSAMGIGEISIIDNDIIELSNTSRQILYSELDIGQYKTKIAKRKLKEYNSSIKINDFNIFIDDEIKLTKILKDNQPNIIALCADNPRGKIQHIVDNVCHQLKIPFIVSAPLAKGEIMLGPFIIPGKSKSFKSYLPDNKRYDNEYNSLIKDLNSNFSSHIIEPYNAIAANFSAIEILKYITNIDKLNFINKVVFLDIFSLEFKQENF